MLIIVAPQYEKLFVLDLLMNTVRSHNEGLPFKGSFE